MKIDLRTFGGLVPKLSPRATPADGAQVSHNLYQNTPEFVPLPGDVTAVAASGTTNPKTIFRFKRNADGTLNTNFASAAKWRASSVRQSWARGQVNNDLTDRHYVSFDDGSAPPRAIDAAGGDRQLGVPQPAAAPTVTINAVDQFSTDDRTAAISAMMYDLHLASNNTFIAPIWRGSTSGDSADYRPGNNFPGYVDRILIPGVDPLEAQQLRVFKTSSAGGADNGSITSDYVGGSKQTWPFDGGLNGVWVPSTGTWPGFVTWVDRTHDHWAIPFHAYGLTYDFEGSNLVGYLSAMLDPGSDPPALLLTADQVNGALAAAQGVFNDTWDAAKPKLDALHAKVKEAKVIFDSGTQQSLVTGISTYYASSAITAYIDGAVTAAAEAMWNAAVQANSYVEWVAPGGGA